MAPTGRPPADLHIPVLGQLLSFRSALLFEPGPLEVLGFDTALGGGTLRLL
jgi:hypothetical protein